MSRLEILHSNLILFAFIVYITMGSSLRLLLVLKEGIMKHLIVNVDFAHLRLHALSHLLLECLSFVSLGCLLPQLANPCLLYEVWQLEWNLMNASLVLEIAAFLGPVSRYRH